jgi:predicted small metal-binding protein
MAKTLFQIDCDPTCGFRVRSHSKGEALEMSMTHVKKVHPKLKMTKKEAEQMVKRV